MAPSYQGLIFVTTANGVDHSNVNLPAPNAPSLICFDKDTGEAKRVQPSGPNVLFSELSSPLVADIGGRGQVVMPHGDGWVRSYDPQTGTLIWECDTNLKDSQYSSRDRQSTRGHFLSTPVLHENRLDIATGTEPEKGPADGQLLCIDPTKSGDISAELAVNPNASIISPRRFQNVSAVAGERAIPNPNSGIIWSFADQYASDDVRIGFAQRMYRTVANAVIHNGSVYVTDLGGILHCIDTQSGKPRWYYDLFMPAWASPLVVGDTLYAANEDGAVLIVDLSTESGDFSDARHVEPLAAMHMPGKLLASPVFANGVLYIVTAKTLYAVESPSK